MMVRAGTEHRISIFPRAAVAMGAFFLGMILLIPGPSAWALSRQVLIEAQIWELSNDENYDWGVIWDYNSKKNSSSADFQLFSGDLRLPVFDESGDPPKGLFGSVDVFDLRYGIMNLRIQAALREGRAQVLANPKIVVVEGEEASVSSGEKVPIVKFEYNSQGQQTLNTVFEDTGVKLVVRAAIHNVSPEFVILDIRPEVKDIAQFVKLTSPDGEFELPLLTTRTAQSKVVVRSGATLIMGGLYQEQTTQLAKGIPGLKDVPMFGGLFRSKARTKSKMDLLIELRPTILLPGKDSFVPAPFTSSGQIFSGSQYRSLRFRPPGQSPVITQPAVSSPIPFIPLKMESSKSESRSSENERERSSGSWY